ncbi:unnamed protein product [Adineta steineri]|uniref:Uncharacterized protein n=1 Tax=Adineta steineri TaxID=433720 RepID=A0A819JMW3_9BILA|nr:unnamed protein product [Adineta steineri]CAF3932469.1 unnamed protein product [Adineta steineri]
MNNNNSNNRILYDNATTILHNKNYYFEPIDHASTSNSTSIQINNSQIIQRPVPIMNHHHHHHSDKVNEQPKKHQYMPQTKRNSTIDMNPSNIDSTIRSHALSRSVTTDRLARNTTTNKLYYYPSVQDVLDALNRRSFDKESFV